MGNWGNKHHQSTNAWVQPSKCGKITWYARESVNNDDNAETPLSHYIRLEDVVCFFCL